MRHLLARLTPLVLAAALPACASLGDGAAGLTAPAAEAASRTIHIGCSRNIGPEAHPILVVDGRVVAANLLKLDPAEIDNIDVLKGPAAMALYGASAREGAVIIRTRAATGS